MNDAVRVNEYAMTVDASGRSAIRVTVELGDDPLTLIGQGRGLLDTVVDILSDHLDTTIHVDGYRQRLETGATYTTDMVVRVEDTAIEATANDSNSGISALTCLFTAVHRGRSARRTHNHSATASTDEER